MAQQDFNVVQSSTTSGMTYNTQSTLGSGVRDSKAQDLAKLLLGLSKSAVDVMSTKREFDNYERIQQERDESKKLEMEREYTMNEISGIEALNIKYLETKNNERFKSSGNSDRVSMLEEDVISKFSDDVYNSLKTNKSKEYFLKSKQQAEEELFEYKQKANMDVFNKKIEEDVYVNGVSKADIELASMKASEYASLNPKFNKETYLKTVMNKQISSIDILDSKYDKFNTAEELIEAEVPLLKSNGIQNPDIRNSGIESINRMFKEKKNIEYNHLKMVVEATIDGLTDVIPSDSKFKSYKPKDLISHLKKLEPTVEVVNMIDRLTEHKQTYVPKTTSVQLEKKQVDNLSTSFLNSGIPMDTNAMGKVEEKAYKKAIKDGFQIGYKYISQPKGSNESDSMYKSRIELGYKNLQTSIKMNKSFPTDSKKWIMNSMIDGDINKVTTMMGHLGKLAQDDTVRSLISNDTDLSFAYNFGMQSVYDDGRISEKEAKAYRMLQNGERDLKQVEYVAKEAVGFFNKADTAEERQFLYDRATFYAGLGFSSNDVMKKVKTDREQSFYKIGDNVARYVPRGVTKDDLESLTDVLNRTKFKGNNFVYEGNGNSMSIYTTDTDGNIVAKVIDNWSVNSMKKYILDNSKGMYETIVKTEEMRKAQEDKFKRQRDERTSKKNTSKKYNKDNVQTVIKRDSKDIKVQGRR